MTETPYRKYKLYSPDASPDLTASGEYNSAVMAIDSDIHGLGATDDELRKRLEAEEAAREQGDTDLWGGLTNESTVRKQADTALGGRIDTEKQARESADTALGGRIDTEKGRITQEIADRKAADMVLFNANKEIPDAVWDVIKRSPHQTVADGNRHYMYCSLSNSKNVPNKVQYTSVYFVDPFTPEQNGESVHVVMAGAIYDLNTKAKLDIGEYKLVLHRYFDFAHLKNKPFSTIGRGLKVESNALMVDEGALPPSITPNTTWKQIEA